MITKILNHDTDHSSSPWSTTQGLQSAWDGYGLVQYSLYVAKRGGYLLWYPLHFNPLMPTPRLTRRTWAYSDCLALLYSFLLFSTLLTLSAIAASNHFVALGIAYPVILLKLASLALNLAADLVNKYNPREAVIPENRTRMTPSNSPQ